MKIEQLTQKLHITPSAMQLAAAEVLTGSTDNLLLLSPTGSGKTLAYLLPLVTMIDMSSAAVQAIVVCPGRELAAQSVSVLTEMKSGVRGYACYGGRPAMDEHRELKSVQPHILFGTPGRLIDHIEKQNFQLGRYVALVVDEFDKCMDMGFREELLHLKRILPQPERTVLLSATDATDMPRFVDKGKTVRLDFTSDESGANDTRIAIGVVHSEQKDKLEPLAMILRTLGGRSTIVFLNHRDAVERTAQYLSDNGFAVVAYHGGLEQKVREERLFKFSFGAVDIMICTDLGSRGLDIPNVDTVIHYHLPETEDNYIHRIGRTARWQAVGNTIFILSPGEQLPAYVPSAEEMLLPQNPPPPARPRRAILYIGKGKKDKISKFDIVGFLCKTAGLQSEDILRISLSDRYAYVALPEHKMNGVLKKLSGQKIKGKKTVFEPLR